MRGALAVAILVPVIQEAATTLRHWIKQRRKDRKDRRDEQIAALEERIRNLEQQAEAEARWR